jgi:hypothetical protein
MINAHDSANYYNSGSVVVNDSFGIFLEFKEKGALELRRASPFEPSPISKLGQKDYVNCLNLLL